MLLQITTVVCRAAVAFMSVLSQQTSYPHKRWATEKVVNEKDSATSIISLPYIGKH